MRYRHNTLCSYCRKGHRATYIGYDDIHWPERVKDVFGCCGVCYWGMGRPSNFMKLPRPRRRREIEYYGIFIE